MLAQWGPPCAAVEKIDREEENLRATGMLVRARAPAAFVALDHRQEVFFLFR